MYTKKLSRADKKAIDAAIRKAKKDDKKQMSAQDSIPFQQMFKDGICKVCDNYYRDAADSVPLSIFAKIFPKGNYDRFCQGINKGDADYEWYLG